MKIIKEDDLSLSAFRVILCLKVSLSIVWSVKFSAYAKQPPVVFPTYPNLSHTFLFRHQNQL